MSNIVNNIYNKIYGLAYETTRAINPIASFTYPYIIKQEVVKYFINYNSFNN